MVSWARLSQTHSPRFQRPSSGTAASLVPGQLIGWVPGSDQMRPGQELVRSKTGLAFRGMTLSSFPLGVPARCCTHQSGPRIHQLCGFWGCGPEKQKHDLQNGHQAGVLSTLAGYAGSFIVPFSSLVFDLLAFPLLIHVLVMAPKG